ncbi:MAG TPA: ABC transporter permease [Patescibacteria group bacterium]|nr:ABC transporter permease [Patescibacteria group bacterium]
MKELFEIFIESLGTLTLNKLRTGLAMLGIVIGIGSVIALVSLGEASQQSIQNQIQALGANLLTVSPGSQQTGAVRGAEGGATTLTNDDATAIQTSPQVTSVSMVSPEVSKRVQVTAGRNNSNIQVIGAVPAYMDVHKVTMSSGTFITDQDNAGMTKVVVLGPQVVTTLFPDGSDPVGQTIRINSISFRVIGVTVSKGGTGFSNQDNIAYIPLQTAQKEIFGQSYLSTISLEAKSSDLMTTAENQVGYLLLARHKLQSPALADFSIFSQQDILNTASATTGTFTTLLSGIAAISLLVGGIGIMNIMLVTVTERTREIGLRKALGAKKRTIITQFLTEAIILTFSGGLIGIILGVILSYIVAIFTSSPFVISGSAMLLAFIVSAGIGVLFGWYPARKAASLQPIEALRYE